MTECENCDEIDDSVKERPVWSDVGVRFCKPCWDKLTKGGKQVPLTFRRPW